MGGHELDSMRRAGKGCRAEVVLRFKHCCLRMAVATLYAMSSQTLLTPGAVLLAVICRSALYAGAAWACTRRAGASCLLACQT